MHRIHIADLEAVELFAGCTRREMWTIAGLCTQVDVGPRRTLCEEGEVGLEFFVMTAGRVDVRRDTRPIATLDDGQWFGEVALTTRAARRIASVTTARPSTLLVFGRHEFASLLTLSPTVGLAVRESSRSRAAACASSAGAAISQGRLGRAGERTPPARIPPGRVGGVCPDGSRHDLTARFDRRRGRPSEAT